MPPEAEAVDSSVREAALAAMQTAGLGEENWPQDPETDPETEVTDEDTDPEAAAEAPASAEEEAEEESEEVEAEAAAEEDDSVPKEWFGVDLSGFPSEKRAEIIEAFKEQDRYAQSLAQRLAEKGKESEGEAEAEPEEPEALDDDALMKMLGVDEDDPMYDVKKEIQAPLARIIVEQQQVLQQVQARDEEQQFIAWWESGLDEMEQQFGPLSIDREDLAQIALKEGLRTPQEAYARVALSGRKTVEDLVSKAKEGVKEKAKKPKPATQRPRSDTAATKKPAKNMTPTEAAEAAAKELGFDWGESLQGVT